MPYAGSARDAKMMTPATMAKGATSSAALMTMREAAPCRSEMRRHAMRAEEATTAAAVK